MNCRDQLHPRRSVRDIDDAGAISEAITKADRALARAVNEYVDAVGAIAADVSAQLPASLPVFQDHAYGELASALAKQIAHDMDARGHWQNAPGQIVGDAMVRLRLALDKELDIVSQPPPPRLPTGRNGLAPIDPDAETQDLVKQRIADALRELPESISRALPEQGAQTADDQLFLDDVENELVDSLSRIGASRCVGEPRAAVVWIATVAALVARHFQAAYEHDGIVWNRFPPPAS